MATDDTAGSSKTQENKPSVRSTQPKNLPLNFLRDIPDSFSKERELSRDASGEVYKGTALDGQEIVVRRIMENGPLPRDKEYNNEEMATDDTAGSSKTQENKPSVLSTLPMNLPFDFLRTITDSFSKERELISDAFGEVYKAIAPDGQVIAVRRIMENGGLSPDEVYKNEVGNIMALRHENIVRLVAYCDEGQKKVVLRHGRYIVADIFEFLLCYDYLPRGSTRDILFDTKKNPDTNIGWSTRFKIIKGVCHGLSFLHGLSTIHVDLKPENIWLDENLVPKIANFGLSVRLDPGQDEMQRQLVMGSVGYLAPEYLYRGRISAQVDIYSLGILIIEITTKEKNTSDEKELSGRAYIDRISQRWTEQYIASMYPSFEVDLLREVNTCIKIGLECVEVDPNNRPSIDEVVDKLYAGSASWL